MGKKKKKGISCFYHTRLRTKLPFKEKNYILEVFSNSSQWFICPRRKYGVYLGFDTVEDFGNNLNKWNSEGGLASGVFSASVPSVLSFIWFNL